MAVSHSDVTRLLRAANQGDTDAVRRLLPIVYESLHELAARYMADERRDHTLQPTALVHEAFLRLVGHSTPRWEGSEHFFAVAAQAMRNILVDHARRRLAQKRGGDAQRVPLDALEPGQDLPDDAYLVALDAALSRLSEFDSQAARVVELRFFAGLGVEQAAKLLGISERSVKRDWQMAKGWLHREIEKAGTL